MGIWILPSLFEADPLESLYTVLKYYALLKQIQILVLQFYQYL
jgi:hypothetical protein